MLLLLWHLQPMTAGHELDWNDRVTAGQSRTLDWNDRTVAASSRVVVWNDRAVVSQSRTLDWNDLATVLLAVQRSLRARWGVYVLAIPLSFSQDLNGRDDHRGVDYPDLFLPPQETGTQGQDGTSRPEDRQTTDVQDGNMDSTQRGVKEGQT